MTFSPLGSYRPGRGPMHRLRPGTKLLGLVGFALLVVSTQGVTVTAIWLAAAITFAVLAGLRGRDLWRVLSRFSLVAVPLLAFTVLNAAVVEGAAGDWSQLGSLAPDAWLHGWQRGFEVVGDLFALILAASAVTASTAVDDMLDTVTWALTPLRPLGVRPERVALAFSLVIRAIPSILLVARETREAARARGLGRDPRALVVPLALRTVAHAQATGEALAARGIGEEETADR